MLILREYYGLSLVLQPAVPDVHQRPSDAGNVYRLLEVIVSDVSKYSTEHALAEDTAEARHQRVTPENVVDTQQRATPILQKEKNPSYLQEDRRGHGDERREHVNMNESLGCKNSPESPATRSTWRERRGRNATNERTLRQGLTTTALVDSSTRVLDAMMVCSARVKRAYAHSNDMLTKPGDEALTQVSGTPDDRGRRGRADVATTEDTVVEHDRSINR